MANPRELFKRRQTRNRARLRKFAEKGVLRLSVFRSNRNISAQIIDDVKGVTLASASSVEKGWDSKKFKGCDKASAEAVGKLVAERAKKSKITKVVFDRGAYLYHGRVKALAEGARAGGLEF